MRERWLAITWTGASAGWGTERDVQRFVELAAIGQAGEAILIGEFAGLSLGGDAADDFTLLRPVVLHHEAQQSEEHETADKQGLVEFDHAFG